MPKGLRIWVGNWKLYRTPNSAIHNLKYKILIILSFYSFFVFQLEINPPNFQPAMSSISQLLTENNLHQEILSTAGKLADKDKITAFVVGGFVRDVLLGKSTNDVDIMVEGDGIEFAQKLAQKLGVDITVDYEKFGTALIPHPEVDIEVATARKENYQTDSRKPQVSSSTLEEDMSRRDFTINAIAASILPNSFGELYDPFKGIKDLQKGLIITPLDPDETFSDDPLRMLRAVRFAAQLEYEVAPTALESISRNIKRLEIVSWERIRDEVLKTLKTDKPSIAFRMKGPGTVYSKVTVKEEIWYHAAGTYDGDEIKIYINGKLSNFMPGGGAIAVTDNVLIIGAALNGLRFHGIIDEVGLYNRALTPKEVKGTMEGLAQSVDSKDKAAVVWGMLKSQVQNKLVY